MEDYPSAVARRYRFDSDSQDMRQAFEQAAVNRGCLRSGGLPDLNRFSAILIDEFRGGQIGLITLERPRSLQKEAR